MGPSYPEHLPTITETKSSLRGKSCSFSCRLISHAPDRAVVLFIAGKPNQVGGISLPAGTLTLGYFWPARPYNAYHFMTPGGMTIAHYFNVADGTNISAERLDWRDLEADVLVTPDGQVRVLDTQKIPADTAAELRAHIAETCQSISTLADSLVAEMESASDGLFRGAFLRERASGGPT